MTTGCLFFKNKVILAQNLAMSEESANRIVWAFIAINGKLFQKIVILADKSYESIPIVLNWQPEDSGVINAMLL